MQAGQRAWEWGILPSPFPWHGCGLQLVGDSKIKTDDGEEVTIRARGETPVLALELVSSSVEHTSIEIRG
jgi:hypothetical protein